VVINCQISAPFHIMILIILNDFSIFSIMYSRCSLNYSSSSNMIPRYLYLRTIGYPYIVGLSLSCYLILASDLLFFLMYRTPDFYLFITMLASSVHDSTTSIAILSYFSPMPVITKSSAYAARNRSLSFNLSSSWLNAIKKMVGLSTPPYMTPYPMSSLSSPTFIFVTWYNHLIVSVSSSFILYFFIYSNIYLWFTPSNALFRSMNKAQVFFPIFLYLSRLPLSLRMLISQPYLDLNPICSLFSLNPPSVLRSFYNLLLSMVSSSLYSGDVLVIGLALSKLW